LIKNDTGPPDVTGMGLGVKGELVVVVGVGVHEMVAVLRAHAILLALTAAVFQPSVMIHPRASTAYTRAHVSATFVPALRVSPY